MSQRAAVIAAANSKGGSGKSTAILILAGEYAAQGYRVHVIDADPKKRLVRWAHVGVKPESITVSEANAGTMRDEIDKARPCLCQGIRISAIRTTKVGAIRLESLSENIMRDCIVFAT